MLPGVELPSVLSPALFVVIGETMVHQVGAIRQHAGGFTVVQHVQAHLFVITCVVVCAFYNYVLSVSRRF